MDPILTPLLVTSGVNLATSGFNAWMQERTNKQQQAFSNEMYAKQRADALSDWSMQNAYNSPEQQMNRLRQAGLNPHLIYGKGADNTAMAVRSAQQQSYSPIAPRLDLSSAGSALLQYYDLKQKVAQTDNVEAATALAKKQAVAVDAGIASTLQGTARSKFELEQAQRVADAVVEKTLLDNELTKVRTAVEFDRNERERIMNSANVAKALQEVLQLKLRNAMNPLERQHLEVMISNAQKEGQLRAKDVEWRQDGLTPSDPIYWRVLMDFLNGNKNRSEYPRTSSEVDKAIRKIRSKHE